MKSILTTAIALAALISSPVMAAPYETLGGPNGGGSNVASSFGVALTVIGNTVVVPPGSVIGTADASVSLDGANNGFAQIFSTNLLLEDISGNATIPGLANVDFDFVGVTIDITTGAVPVTGGNFAIDSSTPGSLSLSSGLIEVSGIALGNPINQTIDLSTAPVTVTFADLGGAVLLGTADDSLGGVDTTHSGDEITIDWAGTTATFLLDLNGSQLPIGLLLSGDGLSIGSVVPEPTSGLFLATMVAGACGVARRRRK